MTNVLVCWEDRFHQELDRCLRRALRHTGLLSPPQLYSIDCGGNGGFVPYIKRTWAIAVTRGLPKTAGAIDYLVCVADADRASKCCDIEPAEAITADWIGRANHAWTTKLRTAATMAPERISGQFLRWNQESLLIAAHDVEETLTALGCRNRSLVTKHLQGCSPSPLQIADAAFVDHFRKPERCLEDMLKAAGVSLPKKGTPPRGDALEAASKHAIDRLCARVPDLAALADAIRNLPSGAVFKK
jgi:hypothetical protein